MIRFALLPFRMKPHQAVMGGVFAAALAAGFAMLPGNEVRVAMLERDGHSREALALLEDRYASGDRNYRILYQMVALHENEGNAARAGEILNEMVAQRPRDIVLRRRITKFYRDTQNASAMTAALIAELSVRYSEAACRDLIAQHRLAGDYVLEKTAIQSCRQQGYRRPDDLARLAELLAVDGDTAQAASILRSIDDVKRLKDSRGRYQLLAFLIKEQQPKEAERRALRWIKSERDDAFTVGLIDAFAQSDFPDSAIELAKTAGQAGDGVALTVAERLLEKSQPAAARLYLKGWLESAASADPETAARFVAAATEAGDAETAFAGVKKFRIQKLSKNAGLKLATALRSAGLREQAREILASIAPADTAPTQPIVGSEAVTELEAPLPSVSAAAAAASKSLGGDPLALWRQVNSARVTKDAAQWAVALGFPGTKQRVVRSSSNAKVLKKTARVLQRTKTLRTLKQKKKLAQQKSKPVGGAAVAPAPAPRPAPKPQISP